jgi:hypothetical protein
MVRICRACIPPILHPFGNLPLIPCTVFASADAFRTVRDYGSPGDTERQRRMTAIQET